jgi:8-oxo-dGTP pyrophosphatase MutT (NUDIX family)
VAHKRAAGGVLERRMAGSLRLAVVHRSRYSDHAGGDGDWVLPKGKAHKKEGLTETALREVEEETGSQARIVGPSFEIEYLVGADRKTVTFFKMECVSHGGSVDASEVREVVWLTPRQAIARLTYDSEREVLRQAYPELLGDVRTRTRRQSS